MDNTNKDELNKENNLDKVDFYIYEADMARAERHTHRWMIAFFVSFVFLIASNVAWIRYENQFEDVVTTTQTVTQDTNQGGTNSFNGDFYGGDYNGKTDSEKNVK